VKREPAAEILSAAEGARIIRFMNDPAQSRNLVFDFRVPHSKPALSEVEWA